MKNYLTRITVLACFALIVVSCNIIPDGISGATKRMELNGNSLFHQTSETSMVTGILEIAGEVEGPGKVNLENHYKREVIVKESLFDAEYGIEFIGAYRYKGYSLFDLLHPYKLNKKNAEIFKPAIDAYIVIENTNGEKVVFSWSEIFHTINPHQVIIATEAAPVVPFRKEVDYPVSEHWKVIAGGDLFAFRTLENPSKITVISFDKKEFPITRNMNPMVSQAINVFKEDTQLMTIEPDTNKASHLTYYSNFYGMGMGYHDTKNFSGPGLLYKLQGSVDPFDAELNRLGLVCFAGIDGYRSIFSFSELFNRADQVAPILAVTPEPEEWGFYRNYSPSDFYADRSVKSIKEIYIFKP